MWHNNNVSLVLYYSFHHLHHLLTWRLWLVNSRRWWRGRSGRANICPPSTPMRGLRAPRIVVPLRVLRLVAGIAAGRSPRPCRRPSSQRRAGLRYTSFVSLLFNKNVCFKVIKLIAVFNNVKSK